MEGQKGPCFFFEQWQQNSLLTIDIIKSWLVNHDGLLYMDDPHLFADYQ